MSNVKGKHIDNYLCLTYRSRPFRYWFFQNLPYQAEQAHKAAFANWTLQATQEKLNPLVTISCSWRLVAWRALPYHDQLYRHIKLIGENR